MSARSQADGAWTPWLPFGVRQQACESLISWFSLSVTTDMARAGARERETLASVRGLTKLLDMDAPAAGMRGPSAPRSPTPVPPLACAAAALQRLALRRASWANHTHALRPSSLVGWLHG